MRYLICLIIAILATGCALHREVVAMPNNFPDFQRTTWLYQAETTAIEREYREEFDFEEATRAVEYLTVYQDCQSVSLLGEGYRSLKENTQLQYPLAVYYASHYGPTTRTFVRPIGIEWSIVSLQATSGGDGTSRVTMTIRFAGPWGLDPYVDVEE